MNKDREGLFCDECGFEEEELYEIDDKKYCKHCLDREGIVTIHTTESYYANGEWFDEDEYEEAIKYLDGKIISEVK